MSIFNTSLDIIKIRLQVVYTQILALPLCLKTPQYARLLVHYFLLDCFYFSHSRLRKEQDLSKIDTNELSYGETCLRTVDTILKRVPIRPTDSFMDLGCGKGKLCFYVHTRYKLPVIGVDTIPSFIEHAKSIAHRYKLAEYCQFHHCNFLDLHIYPSTILLVTLLYLV